MQPARTQDIVLVNQTITQNTTTPLINMAQAWQGITFIVSITTVSGTSPTFDVYVQRLLPSAASTDVAPFPPTGAFVPDDLLHFTQMTTTANRVINLVSASATGTANAEVITTADYTISNAALTAANSRICPVGDNFQVKVVVSGTSSSGFVSLVARLYPVGS